MEESEITNTLSFKKNAPNNSRCVQSSPGTSHSVLLKAHMGGCGGISNPVGELGKLGPRKGKAPARSHIGVAARSDLEAGFLGCQVPEA